MVDDNLAVKGKLIIGLFSLFFVLLIFILMSPFFAPSGSLRNLDGKEKRIDNNEKWEKLDIFPKIFYQFGDLVCHQKESRSLKLNGNLMPVCSRDVGIYIGFATGFFIVLIIPQNSSFLESCFTILPKKLKERRIAYINTKNKRWIIGLTVTGFLLPLALDGCMQLLTSYESTNTIRILTGFFFFSGGSYFLGVLIGSSIVETYDEQ